MSDDELRRALAEGFDPSEDLCCGDCPRWRGIVGEGMRGVCLEPEDTDLALIRMMDEPACEDEVSLMLERVREL